MKRRLAAIAVFVACAVIAFSCREQPSPASGKQPSSAEVSLAASPSALSCDSLLAAVLNLENRLRANYRDTKGTQELLRAAFDSVSGCFFTVGRGTFNHSHPGAAQETERTMAARLDAKRWALYLKSIALGRNAASFGGNIAGEVTYSSTLCERTNGDTLALLLKIPLGSVALR
jgi:hypothetical protein